MLVGAHVPTQGSYVKMLQYAASVECECIQMFAKSPRQWNAKPLDPFVAATLCGLCDEWGIGPVLTHTAYLINLSTEKDELWEKSIEALADELLRGMLLGADGVNTHIGNNPEGDTSYAVRRSAVAIRQAFNLATERALELIDCTDEAGCGWASDELRTELSNGLLPSRLILENTAGSGSSFGTTVGELASVIEATSLDEKHLGICIDTCHAWGAGYDVASVDGWDGLIKEIESHVGLKRFRWIHANDSLHGRGSRKDRHAWIGRGEIGIDGFITMMTDSRLSHVNVVTEMPGKMPEKDETNIALLKGFRDALA